MRVSYRCEADWHSSHCGDCSLGLRLAKPAKELETSHQSRAVYLPVCHLCLPKLPPGHSLPFHQRSSGLDGHLQHFDHGGNSLDVE